MENVQSSQTVTNGHTTVCHKCSTEQTEKMIDDEMTGLLVNKTKAQVLSAHESICTGTIGATPTSKLNVPQNHKL